MKLLLSDDYSYVKKDDEAITFARKGIDTVEELRLERFKFVDKTNNLVFISFDGNIEPTYASQSQFNKLYRRHTEFGNDLTEEEFIFTLI